MKGIQRFIFISLIVFGLGIFFGVITFKSADMNDFFNLVRDWLK